MNVRRWHASLLLGTGIMLMLALPAWAEPSFPQVADEVNQKMVKVFGSGGYRGLASYGTGLLVSPDGYILTAAGQMLDTPDLRIHLPDGRRFHAEVMVIEPELDVALIKIKEKIDDLPFFQVPQAAAKPLVDPGTQRFRLQQRLPDRHAR